MKIPKFDSKKKLTLIAFTIFLVLPFGATFLLKTKKEFPEFRRLAGQNFSDFEAVKKFFVEVADKKDAVYAFNLLSVAPLPDNTDVHDLGHAIGTILYKQKGAEGIKDCTIEFRNACAHAVVIQSFLDRGVDSINNIAKICRSAPGGPEAYGMCFHGLGHGLMAYSNYRLIPALNLCRRLEDNEHGDVEIQECVGGIIMESSIGAHDPLAWGIEKKSYFREDNPLYPCDQSFVPEKGRKGCFFYLTSHLWQAAEVNTVDPQPKDFKNAFQFCERLTGDLAGYKLDCYEGFGKEFVGFAQASDIRKIPDMTKERLEMIGSWCLLAENPAGREVCIKQALNSLFWGAETRSDTLLRFCNAGESLDYQAICYQHLTDIFNYYEASNTKFRNLCRLLPEVYIDRCYSLRN